MDWWYAEAGKQVGPVAQDAFDALVAAGRIAADTLVWHDGLAAWAPYAQLAAPAQPAPAPTPAEPPTPGGPPTATCCECGRVLPLDEMVRYEDATVCAACKPVFFQRIKEGAALDGTLAYGTFGMRFVAKVIDGVLLGAVNVAMGFLAGVYLGPKPGQAAPSFLAVLGFQGALYLAQLLVGATYTTLFLGKFGATPGKMACRLRVVRPDGARLTYLRALGRYFGELLSGLTLYIGYIMAAFDEEHRALHDRICDTRVIRTD